MKVDELQLNKRCKWEVGNELGCKGFGRKIILRIIRLQSTCVVLMVFRAVATFEEMMESRRISMTDWLLRIFNTVYA